MFQNYNSAVDAVEQTIHNHLRQLMLASTKFATLTELMVSVCTCPYRRYYDRFTNSIKMSTIKDEMYVYSIADCLNELLCLNVGNIRTLVPPTSWLILPSDYANIEEGDLHEPYDDSDYTTDPTSNVQTMEDIILGADTTNESSSGSATAFATAEPQRVDWIYVEDDDPDVFDDSIDTHVYDNSTTFNDCDQMYTESVAPYITDWADEQLIPVGNSSSDSYDNVEVHHINPLPQRHNENIPPPSTERTKGCDVVKLTGSDYSDVMNAIHMC